MSEELDRVGRRVVEEVDGQGYRPAGFYSMTRVRKKRCPVCWNLDEQGHELNCELAAHLEDSGE